MNLLKLTPSGWRLFEHRRLMRHRASAALRLLRDTTLPVAWPPHPPLPRDQYPIDWTEMIAFGWPVPELTTAFQYPGHEDGVR